MRRASVFQVPIITDNGPRTSDHGHPKMLSFTQALNIVKDKLAAANLTPGTEVVPVSEARGRVLAEDIAADRDYPPFNRSIRDGFAVRAEDVMAPPVELRLRGEIRAGGHFDGAVG